MPRIGVLAAALIALSAPSLAAAAPACDPMQTRARASVRAPTTCAGLRDLGGERVRGDVPRVALWQLSQISTAALESAGWLRYLFERVWELPYDNVTTAEVRAGALANYDTVVVPNSSNSQSVVTWREGTRLAALLGVTTVQLAEPTSDVPGSLLRVRVDEDSPLERGVGSEAYAFYEYDRVMRASSPSHVAVGFPPADSEDWFISG